MNHRLTTTGQLEITVDESVFSETIVLKASYWHTSEHAVSIQRLAGSNELVVQFTPSRVSFDEETMRALVARFSRDLIDFRTRQIVGEETRIIRELLVAKAFASDPQVE